MCYTRLRISILKMFALAQIVNYCMSCIYIYLLSHHYPLMFCRVCIPVHGLENYNITIQICASTQHIHLKSHRTRAAVIVFLKQKRGLLSHSEHSANRAQPMRVIELTFKIRLDIWILTKVSHIHGHLWDSLRAFPYCYPFVLEPVWHDWQTRQLWHRGTSVEPMSSYNPVWPLVPCHCLCALQLHCQGSSLRPLLN